MKHQSLFSGRNKKKFTMLSDEKFTQHASVKSLMQTVKVNLHIHAVSSGPSPSIYCFTGYCTDTWTTSGENIIHCHWQGIKVSEKYLN